MKLAFLMMFHRDIEVCRNRIKMLRKYNPGMPIYGMYGGELEEEKTFRRALKESLDDYCYFDEEQSSEWKWFNFDLIMAKWYVKRGKDLDFDSVVWVHWDQLVLASIKGVFKNLKKGEIFFSGMRPVKEVEGWWNVMSKEEKQPSPKFGYTTYTNFLTYLKETYNYSEEPICSQSFLCVLPRKFLEPYSKLTWPVLGYGEYTMPMYAQVFGVPFYTSYQMDVWWAADPQKKNPRHKERALTAAGNSLPFIEILKLSAGKRGQKLIHPCYKIYPMSIGDWFRLLRCEFLK